MTESKFSRRSALALCIYVSFLAGPDGANSQDATPATDAARIALVGRMVADIDRSIAFYETLGFRQDRAVNASWREDERLDRLFGISGVEYRTAKMVVDSNVSGRPFSLYLHELRGIERKTMSGYPITEPGATHFGFTAVDIEQVWSQLKSSNMLNSRTRTGELVVGRGQTRPSAAYMTDPDGLDIELGRQRPASPATDDRPAMAAVPPGVSHIGLVVLDVDKAKGFYGDVLGGQSPVGDFSQWQGWMQGDWIDDLIGGQGNVVRVNFVMFPEAAAPNALLRWELIEYQVNEEKYRDSEQTVDSYAITDIGVGYAGFEVQDLDTVLSRVTASGAKIVTRAGPVELENGSRAILVRDPDTAAFVELFERP